MGVRTYVKVVAEEGISLQLTQSLHSIFFISFQLNDNFSPHFNLLRFISFRLGYDAGDSFTFELVLYQLSRDGIANLLERVSGWSKGKEHSTHSPNHSSRFM
jgi:hypothetical protein